MISVGHGHRETQRKGRRRRLASFVCAGDQVVVRGQVTRAEGTLSLAPVGKSVDLWVMERANPGPVEQRLTV